MAQSGANHSLCPTGAKYTFTIKEGADGKNGRISVNYDGFIDDVGVNDMLLVDGGMLSLKILEKTKQDVVCEVVDGGVMGSRYILYYILSSKKTRHWVCHPCTVNAERVHAASDLVCQCLHAHKHAGPVKSSIVLQGNVLQFLHVSFLVCLTCTCCVVVNAFVRWW